MDGDLRSGVGLRPVTDSDIPRFFEHQRDERATAMAGFPAQDGGQHLAHWSRIRDDDTVVTRTITLGDVVVGNVVSWLEDDRREIGYWVDPQHWGRGIASRALVLFVAELPERPLYARVAAHNSGSVCVLEKAGFRSVTGPRGPEEASSEYRYELG